MSYIRCLSNPEGLYVWGTTDGRVEMCTAAEPIHSMPRYVFHGLLKRFLDERYSHEIIRHRGGMLACDNSNGFRWDLYYKGQLLVTMYEVTLFYIAKNAEFRWIKKKRSKR